MNKTIVSHLRRTHTYLGGATRVPTRAGTSALTNAPSARTTWRSTITPLAAIAYVLTLMPSYAQNQAFRRVANSFEEDPALDKAEKIIQFVEKDMRTMKGAEKARAQNLITALTEHIEATRGTAV